MRRFPLEDQGLVTLESAFSVSETIDRLVEAVDAAALLVFARIDHGQGATDIGASLRPTQLLVFGHPRGGTPLMLERQTAGIDLPLKALAWEDENGRRSTYDSAWIRERHGSASSRPTQLLRSRPGSRSSLRELPPKDDLHSFLLTEAG